MSDLVPYQNTSLALPPRESGQAPASGFMAQLIGDLMTAAGNGEVRLSQVIAAHSAYARQARRLVSRRA